MIELTDEILDGCKIKQITNTDYFRIVENNVDSIVQTVSALIDDEIGCLVAYIDRLRGFRGMIPPENQHRYNMLSNEIKILQNEMDDISDNWFKPSMNYVIATGDGGIAVYSYTCNEEIHDVVRFDNYNCILQTEEKTCVHVALKKVYAHGSINFEQMQPEFIDSYVNKDKYTGTWKRVSRLSNPLDRFDIIGHSYKRTYNNMYLYNGANIFLISCDDKGLYNNMNEEINTHNDNTCKVCNRHFYVGDKQIKFFDENNYKHPRTCPVCFINKSKN